jgi:hypothetical protein
MIGQQKFSTLLVGARVVALTPSKCLKTTGITVEQVIFQLPTFALP